MSGYRNDQWSVHSIFGPNDSIERPSGALGLSQVLSTPYDNFEPSQQDVYNPFTHQSDCNGLNLATPDFGQFLEPQDALANAGPSNLECMPYQAASMQVWGSNIAKQWNPQVFGSQGYSAQDPLVTMPNEVPGPPEHAQIQPICLDLSSDKRSTFKAKADFVRAEKSNRISHSRKQENRGISKSRYRVRQKRKELLSFNRCSSKASQLKVASIPDKKAPSSLTLGACHLWLAKYHGSMPSEAILTNLSVAFEQELEVLRAWFNKEAETFLKDDDTAYQTRVGSDASIASSFRHNRQECNRKVGNLPLSGADPPYFERDEARPFACTSRCERNFRMKDAWKRHEEINRPTRLWLCRFQACQTKSTSRRVWFRKDHFKNHLSNDHTELAITDQEMSTCYWPIESNFSKRCIFQGCNEHFMNWNERINHIGDHLKGPWTMSQWRSTEREEEETEDEEEDREDIDTTDDDSSQSDDSDDGAEDNDSRIRQSDTGHGSDGNGLGHHHEALRWGQGRGSNSQHGNAHVLCTGDEMPQLEHLKIVTADQDSSNGRIAGGDGSREGTLGDIGGSGAMAASVGNHKKPVQESHVEKAGASTAGRSTMGLSTTRFSRARAKDSKCEESAASISPGIERYLREVDRWQEFSVKGESDILLYPGRNEPSAMRRNASSNRRDHETS